MKMKSWKRILLPGVAAIALLSADAAAVSITARTLNGADNSHFEPSFGQANTALRRVTATRYGGDGSGGDMISGMPNPRLISNIVAAQTRTAKNSHGMTDFVWQWGQFLDHDISLTESHAASGVAPIPVAPGDILGPRPIAFNRSIYMPTTGDAPDNPRQQINQITAWIDGSNVYGSDDATAASLRTHVDGKLKMSPNDLLPLVNGAFVAGDVRAMEQAGLTAMHTLFVREHNRLAEQIKYHDNALNDEAIYELARKIVGAQMQNITYNEFLPALLGELAPKASDYDYDATINPAIANEFSTAMYRFGHTMLASDLKLVNPDGTPAGYAPLRNVFFNPSFILSDPMNLDRLLAGLASQRANEIDTQLVDDVRNFLFGPPGAGGLDLASLNIQRGRDHGIGSYNDLRIAYGLAPAAGFDDITSDKDLETLLSIVYNSVDDVDAWVGGLAEDHLIGAGVGELIAHAIIEQFIRLRDADRFFYMADPDLRQPIIAAVAGDVFDVKLSDIILRNTQIQPGVLRSNVFEDVPEPASALLLLLSAGLMGRRRGRNA